MYLEKKGKVVAVLGIIAVLTVPALINRHIEAANRAKIKKAMAVYETALNNIVISNGLKSNAELYSGDNAFAPSGDCSKTINYFKVSKQLDENDQCKFMTSDRVYWDISDINKPIVALKEEYLTPVQASDTTTTNAFYFLGYFGNDGILRVNDNIYEQIYGTNDDVKAMVKLYEYTNKIKIEVLSEFLKCEKRGLDICTVNGTPYKKIALIDPNFYYSFGRLSGIKAELTEGNFYYYDFGTSDVESDDYHTLAKNKCIEQGAHLANVAELESLQQQKKITSGNYWAYEENYEGTAYMIKGSGYNGAYHKKSSNYRVICISNNK